MPAAFTRSEQRTKVEVLPSSIHRVQARGADDRRSPVRAPSPRAPALVAGAVAVVALLSPGPTAALAHPSSAHCVATGASAVSGVAAERALGADLSAAAALNGMSSSALARTLSGDSTARLDSCGRLLYADPDVPERVSALALAQQLQPAGVVAGGLNASGDVLSLQSRPGSARTIYLDVHGLALTGTEWNSYFRVADGYWLAPFSLDSDTAHLSVAEQSALRAIWLAVAEDYAPFDVNVTTKDPGDDAIDRSSEADDVFGTRALITSNTALMAQCGCGGIAYTGAFADSYDHPAEQPAIVFMKGTGGLPYNIAAAVSHEVGHTFGLNHDGASGGITYYLGQGAWAPIMGAGYDHPISQWSKGEYARANDTEDDTAIIAESAPYAADEAGTAPATAVTLRSGHGVNAVISGPGDSDWYAVSSLGGPLAVSVATQPTSADLDAKLAVFRVDGSLVASSDPRTPLVAVNGPSTIGMSASWSGTVPAGSYLLRVTGTGNGNPLTTGYTSYGSIGRYTITATTAQASTLAVHTVSVGEAVRSFPLRDSLVAVGVDGSVQWSVVSGGLPPGVVLASATGALSGTPTASGRWALTARAVDRSGHAASRALVLRVVEPMTITSAPWPGAVRGRSYVARSSARGGNGVLVWTRVAGALPPGLVLTRTGVLIGRPTATGTYRFTVRVADYVGAASLPGRSARRAVVIRVGRA